MQIARPEDLPSLGHSLFVVVALEYLAQFGRHVLPLSQSITSKLPDPAHDGREMRHLESIANELFTHPAPE